jgi:hypothetical protein
MERVCISSKMTQLMRVILFITSGEQHWLSSLTRNGYQERNGSPDTAACNFESFAPLALLAVRRVVKISLEFLRAKLRFMTVRVASYSLKRGS